MLIVIISTVTGAPQLCFSLQLWRHICSDRRSSGALTADHPSAHGRIGDRFLSIAAIACIGIRLHNDRRFSE